MSKDYLMEAEEFEKELRFPMSEEGRKQRLCYICGRRVEDNELPPWAHHEEGKIEMDCINGAVVGEYIDVAGHRHCIHAVDELVVFPNRLRVHE